MVKLRPEGNISAPRKPRYTFERDEIVTATYSGCEYCECDSCSCDPPDAWDEVKSVWAIFDSQHGHTQPIAYADQAEHAQRIVDALNEGR
jgi:hypothetical protein